MFFSFLEPFHHSTSVNLHTDQRCSPPQAIPVPRRLQIRAQPQRLPPRRNRLRSLPKNPKPPRQIPYIRTL